LGSVRAWRGAELPLGPPQRRAILAVLTLAAGHPVSREELIAGLWPAAPPPRAVNVIQTHVKHLRQAFEPDRPRRTPSAVLPAVGGGYALRVDPAEVDAQRFRALVGRLREARSGGDRELLRETAADAVRMWRPPVADLPVLRGNPRVRTLVAEWHLVLAQHVEAALDQGRADEVLPVLEEQAVASPLDERIQARLLRAYGAVGRRDAAFAAYERLRQGLAGELGVDPSAELAAAHLELLREDPRPAGPVAPRTGAAPATARPVRLAPRRPPQQARSSPGRAAPPVRCADSGRLELLRTWDVLARVLPGAPAALLDLGAAAGRFAGLLAGSGYTVHAGPPVGGRFDGVLMLDPRRHAAERSGRLRAWREAARWVRPGGVVIAAAVNRIASAFEGLLRSGRPDDGPPGCGSRAVCRTCAPPEYTHRPDELAAELAEAGLQLDRMLALEGPAWAISGLGRILADGPSTTLLLDSLRELEGEPSLLGASARLLVLARPAVAPQPSEPADRRRSAYPR